MKKISLFIIILITAFLVGCIKNVNTELRLYFFNDGSIDRTFAEKLEKCHRYETPIKYTSTWDNLGLIPSSKDKVKIIGMDREERCIVRSYDASYFSPFWKKTYEYRLPKYVLPYFSDIYETAFDEKYGHEIKAIEKLHLFCDKYRDFCRKADIDDKNIPISCKEELMMYIRSLSYDSAVYSKYKYYDHNFP